jgi:hypothetical protein
MTQQQLNLDFDKTETDPIKKYRLGYSNEHYPNLEYISESEFLWRFGGGSGMKVYRQIKLPNMFDYRTTYAQVYAWVQAGGSGVGFEVHSYPYGIKYGTNDYWEKRDYAPPEGVEGRYKARWFKFHACDHKYTTTAQRNCFWAGTCDICGHHSEVDSSD